MPEHNDSFELMQKEYKEKSLKDDSFEQMYYESWQPPSPEEEAIQEDWLLPITAAVGITTAPLYGVPAATVGMATSLVAEGGGAYLGKQAGKLHPSLETPVHIGTTLLSAFTAENWVINGTVKRLARTAGRSAAKVPHKISNAPHKFWSKEFALAKENGWLSKEFVEDSADIIAKMDMGDAEANSKMLRLFEQEAYDTRLGEVGKRLEKLDKLKKTPTKTDSIDGLLGTLKKKKTLHTSDYVKLARIAKEDAVRDYSIKFGEFKSNTINKVANEKWQQHAMKDIVETLQKEGGIPSNYKFASPELAETFMKRHPELINKEGVSANLGELANDFGYNDIDDMVLKIFEAPNQKQLRRMASAELSSEFNRVYADEISTRVASKEADYLFKLHGDTTGFEEGRLLQQKHVEVLRRTEQVLPAKLVMREVKASKRAVTKLLDIIQKSDKKNVSRLKKIYTQRLAEYQAAVKVQKNFGLINNRIKNSFGLGGEYGAQLDNLLAPLFKQSATKPGEHMWAFLTKKYNDEVSIGADVLIKKYNDLLSSLPFQGRTFLDLTYSQAKDLDNFVKVFKFVANNEKYIMRKGEKMLVKHLARGIYKNAQTTLPKLKMLQPRITGTQLEELSKGKLGAIAAAKESTADVAGGFLASLKRIEPICYQLDGFKKFGPAWKNIFNKAAMAEVTKERVGAKIFNKYEDLFKAHELATKMKPRKYWTATGGNLNGYPINKETAVLMALNTKHVDNMEAMLEGLQVTEEALKSFLKGAINASDEKLIDGLLGTLDEMYPILAKVYKKKTGEVLVRPKGGRYFPILRDRRFDNISSSIDDIFLDQAPDMFRASLKDTFTLARKGGVKALRLEFKGLTQHLADTVHYATHWEALNDIQRLTRHPDFRMAVENSMGKKVYEQFDPWLKNLSRPTRTELDTFMGKARRNVTFASLALSPKIAVKQTLSFITAMPEMGYGNSIKALGEYIWSPKELSKAIKTASPEMAMRSKTWNRDMIELMSEIKTVGHKANMMKLGYWMIHKVDDITASVTWLGGYKKGLSTYNGNADLAMNLANSVVRNTQPASAAKDIPLIMRSGEHTRMVAMFYSYWSIFHNQVGTTAAKALSGHMSKREVIGTLAWMVIAPAIAQNLAKAAWDGLTGREQEENRAKEIAKGTALNMVGGLPVARDIGTSWLKGYDYQYSPVLTVMKKGVDMLEAGSKAFDEDAEFTRRDMYLPLELLSYGVPIPSRAMIIATEGVLRNIEKETDDWTEVIDRP